MASDQIITAKLVLQAQLELQRLGIHKAMALLESTEPDLVEYVLETTTNLYHEILRTGASGKQARRIHDSTQTLLLVCITALQKAHATLWQDDPAPELVPKLESRGPESPPAPPSAER